jgi:phosphate:Na+ symporter
VGTTITAILGSMSSNISGKRLAGAHFIFNITTGIVALVFIYPISHFVNYLSDLIGINATDYTLKLALFHTIFNVLGVIIMIPFVKKLEAFLIRFITEKFDKDIDEPKFLNEAVLEFPGTVRRSLLNESKYLYKNAIFEIVAHSLNIHRDDIKSDKKIKKVIKRSKKDMQIDVESLYYKKVKTIYGEIISYAAKSQSTLKLTEKQNNFIALIKVANRKMVEIIRDVRELNKNVTYYLNSDNKYICNEYDKFRKKVLKVLRVIYMFRTQEDKELYYVRLLELKNDATKEIHSSNKSINKLIRKNLITVNMASSLVNDNDNVNDMIKKLISVAEILYLEKESLLENDKT